MTLQVRDHFPFLRREIDGVPVTYLDSAATSLKPNAVLEAERAYLTEYTANVHRGHSAIADEASYEYEAARRKIAQFIKADPATVVFTPNTSYSLAMVASGLNLSPDDTVLCSPNSHHSNLLPWLRRARVEYVGNDPLVPLDPDEVAAAIRQHRPRLIAIGWVSNVSGVISPAAEICRVAREHGVLSVVDAAQAAPHIPIDVNQLGCDFLAFSGHKMMGPTGVGVLWGRREQLEALEPLVVGGGTVDRVTRSGYTLKRLPQRLEPGTPHISGVIGLGAAAEYLSSLGFARIAAYERELVEAMHDVLGGLPGVRVLTGARGTEHLAIASVVPTGANIHSDTLCQILSDSFQIMTRSGFHCAHPLFDGHGFQLGAVRLSAYVYNTVEEVHRAGEALWTILGRVARTAHG
jgi:cysteine desulfurase / selenocysteine lyase